MLIIDTLQLILTAIVVIGVTWIGTHHKSIKLLLVWIPIAAFVPSLIFAAHKLWPTEYTIAEIRTGNANFYVEWNVKYFFIDFIPMFVSIGILALSASMLARFTSVRLAKPKWISITLGVIIALILWVPAMFVGIMVLTAVIPGSWP